MRLYGDILLDYPRDTLALQVAHVGDFFLGQSSCCATAWPRCCRSGTSTPGYGFVLGMHAFGLEETALYARAEATRPHARSNSMPAIPGRCMPWRT